MMKKVLIFMMVVVLFGAFMLFGCTAEPAGVSAPPSSAATETQTSGAEETEGKDSYVVAFSNWSRSFEFYVDMETGMQEKADELGVELILQDANGDLNEQTKQLEDYISRGVDGIIIVPIDSEAAGSEVEMVNNAKIPIVTVDIACTGGGEVESHIASDNFLGGRLAAEYIAQKLGGKGEVAVIDNPTITPLIERRDGFTSVMEEKYPDIKIVTIQSGESTREKGMEVAENILEKYPDLDAIFGTNDMMALGAVQAIQTKNMDTIVVGFDATEEACNAIIDGSPMKASIAQQPKLLGATSLETLIKVLKGESVEETIQVEVQTVSEENVKDFVK